jgi:capsular polysaccharide biosynthesis protein
VELRRYLSIILKRKYLIALTVIAAVVAGWTTTDRTSVYTAQSTIYIGASRFSFDSTSNNISADRAAGLDRIIATFAAMVRSEPLARDALQLTAAPRTVNAVVGATTAGPAPGTNLLVISVADTDPTVAQDLATGLAEALVAKLKDIEPGDTVQEGAIPSIPASIFDRAKLPTVPQPVGLTRKLIVAAMFGFVLSAGLVLLIEYLDVTVKNAEDIERHLELPVLGVIPMNREWVGTPRTPHDGIPRIQAPRSA